MKVELRQHDRMGEATVDVDRMLFSGERITLKRNANLVINRSDFGLDGLTHDIAMGLIGMAGKEGIGGSLHLTNFRLIFAGHSLNRVTGSASIFLSTITDVCDTSRGLAKKMDVSIGSGRTVTFVVWKIPALMSAIHSGRAVLTPDVVTRLRTEISSAPDQNLGELSVSKLGRAIRNGEDLKKIADPIGTLFDIFTNPLSLLTALSVVKLWSEVDAVAPMIDATSGADAALASEVKPTTRLEAISRGTPPPAGWYPSPGGPGLTWWDGHQWTEHRSG